MYTIIGGYLLIMFINFLYFNRKDYKRIDKSLDGFLDIVLIIFAGPFILLYNIATYGIFKHKEKTYGGKFQWGDYIVDINGKEGIYSHNGFVILKGDPHTTYAGDDQLSLVIEGEFKEELKMLEEAQEIQARANKLLANKKKTIFKCFDKYNF